MKIHGSDDNNSNDQAHYDAEIIVSGIESGGIERSISEVSNESFTSEPHSTISGQTSEHQTSGKDMQGIEIINRQIHREIIQTNFVISSQLL